MGYFVIALCGLLFGTATCIFMNVYEATKHKLTDTITAKWMFIPVSRKRTVFNILGVIAIIAIGIELRYMFPDDALVHQVKLQFLLSILLALTFIDYRYRIVPNVVLLFCLAVRIPFLLIEFFCERAIFWDIIKDLGLGVLIFGLFMFVCVFISKGSIGMGDLKLFIIVALYQGLTYSLTSIFMSLLLCFVVSLVLLCFKKKKTKDYLPLVPFILVGTYISIAVTGM